MNALISILFFVAASGIFVAVAFLVSSFLRPHQPNPEKLSTYESGEEALGNAWIPFNYRFYGVAILFVLFELELIFLLPFVYALADSTSAWIFIEVLVFILVLFAGLVYAWKKGFLEWQRPNTKPTVFQSKVPNSMYQDFNKKYQ
jgi:NADH-quinone oxidoreductase subunit A